MVLCQGHPAVGELWGLACHPSRPLFVTASEDKSVCVWNMETKQLEARQQVRFSYFFSFSLVQSMVLGILLVGPGHVSRHTPGAAISPCVQRIGRTLKLCF